MNFRYKKIIMGPWEYYEYVAKQWFIQNIGSDHSCFVRRFKGCFIIF